MKRRRFLQQLLIAPVSGLGTLAPPDAQFADRVVRRLRFTLTFSNPLDRALEKQTFWCYLPASATATQSLRGVQVSMAHRVHDDALGHRILELPFDVFPALAQKVVTVTAEVEFATTARPQLLAQANTWLAAERFIESDDPRIRALASELRGPSKIDTARRIYEWVQSNIIYAGYLAEDLGALHAVLHRRGDCTEYADLVVALSRANGIPARMIGGYVVDRDLAPRPQDYHNWAEIYLEGAWNLVDAQKRRWLEPASEYVAFRIYRDAPNNLVGLAHRYRLHGNLQVTF
jgi:transglutaminase-like putative cysteine protease